MRNPQIPVIALLALLTGTAQAGEPATPAAMARYADQLLDEQKIASDGPGVTVLVARGDQLLYQGARGMASIELGVPLQPDHLMRIGSVTKQFAAATLLKQIDEGKAALDDPLSRFLPDYPDGARITLRQLLNHTSGVKSYTGIPGYMLNPIRRDLSTAELIKEFKDQPVDFQPGEQWAYNNSGYVLVGAVIEAISGKSWHQQLDDGLLKPAQITRVHFQAGDQLFKGMAQGYTLNSRREVAPAGILSMTQPHAAGALIGNAEGLWRWNQALHGGKLISKASHDGMITPVGPAKASRYGFGIGAGMLRGQPLLTHGGGIHGFVSTLNYLPQTQTTVVILRNSDGPGFSMDMVARKLAAFAIGEPFAEHQPVAMTAEQLKAAEGVYAREGQTRMLRVKDGVLTHQRAGGGGGALVPLGDDRYGFVGSLTVLKIERGADGKATGLSLFNNGESDAEHWSRTGELPAERAFVPLSAAQQQALLGDYSSPQFSIRIFLDDKSGRLMGQAPGQPAFALRATTPRRLHVTEVDAQLDFSPDDGQAASVTLAQAGNKLVMPRK